MIFNNSNHIKNIISRLFKVSLPPPCIVIKKNLKTEGESSDKK